MDKLRKSIITGFYMGEIPVLGPTLGTLEGMLYYLVTYHVCPVNLRNLVLGIGVVFFTGLCLWWGGWAERYFNKKDPRPFVLDEIAGFLLACLFIKPMLTPVALVLFRFFDGVKPFPIKRSQALPAGAGIVVDDLLAGVYTNLCIQLIAWKLFVN